MIVKPNSFHLGGRNLSPRGMEWDIAPRSLKTLYWKKFGVFAAKIKDQELAAGLDKNGTQMAAIAQSTREARLSPFYSPMGRADPNAPPLTPVYDASRTRSLLKWEADHDGVTFYWGYDSHTGDSWGVILAYHKTPFGSRPARDVFGLSRNGQNMAKRLTLAWWDAYLARIPATIRPVVNPVVQQPAPIKPPQGKPQRKPMVPWVSNWQESSSGKRKDSTVVAKYRTQLSGFGVK